MSITPHELHDDFPAEADRIAALKAANAHFARLVDEYHALNRAVHGAETNTHPTDRAHEADMRRKRVALKDEIWRMLQRA
ncbi:hypothetical protein U879_08645 [Defluviimonas sp. 20V17]|uniref:DUF465 domain-containing protein n=1 Tax=Allgaiera indica TaxID=765699 RepID=A0AAN4UPK0_9RHOB|nr:DUF465 domain-containing protein [Allgaiera indica]KDB04078.1 hypothetical protein U879_08645 [Defluviimonas sp. 20V17]GHD99439.1 hypothetical protein GCM10008024_06820 [Allgaiera indica]SDW25652.1 hypothetical protein SAMN05444006_102194 [Allgaiera indica]